MFDSSLFCRDVPWWWLEQRKNRHVMSGIRKRVMGNGELGQTKEGGCVACEDSNSIFTKGIMDP